MIRLSPLGTGLILLRQHISVFGQQKDWENTLLGFTMDDERLKNPNNIFGQDYFEEQLARIRNIRSSEQRFYQKLQIFMLNAVLIMIQMKKLLSNFCYRTKHAPLYQ